MPGGCFVARPSGTPAGSSRRRPSALEQRSHTISPSRPQPGHAGGRRTSSTRCTEIDSQRTLSCYASATYRPLKSEGMRSYASESVRRRASEIEWWVPLALATGGVILVLVAWTTILGAEHTAGWGFDFRAYYDAAQRLVATGSPYQALTLTTPFRPGPAGLYLYTPVAALLVVPLTWVGPDG